MSDSASDYASVLSVSKTLANLLWISFRDAPQLKTIFTSGNDISFISAKEIITSTSSEKLSIFLYNISEFITMKNNPPEKPDKPPPIYLTLHYLFTPYTKNPEADQIILSKILQTFMDNPVLAGSLLQGNLAGTDTKLRITLNSLSIDDLNKIWTMISTPYLNSLSYSVSPVKIEPTRQKEGKPVFERKITYRPTRDVPDEH